MAEPIGIASGLVALTVFAFESSLSLYRVVESFRNNKRTIRELKEELEALDGVLGSLKGAVSKELADFSALKLPLFRCGQACREFESLIMKCSAHSSGSKTSSLLDWAKLKYMGEDIVGFKNMLAGYKSTISIALGDANLRTAAVTAQVLKDYQKMITETTTDLEEHLQNIDSRLQALSSRGALISDEDAAERGQIQEERDSTKQCLAICAQVSKQVSQLRPNVFEDVSATKYDLDIAVATPEARTSAKQVTADVFQGIQERLNITASGLETHLQALNKKLQSHPSINATVVADDTDERDRERVQEEIDTIKQCLLVCSQAYNQASQARTNVFDDVLAAQGSHQVVVSTLGDLISAKRVIAEDGAVQWIGQMSDASLQQLSQDRIQETIRPSREKATEPQSGVNAKFTGQYGTGHKLS